VFAPGELYKGVPIQDFLQSAYFKCYAHLAARMKDAGNFLWLIIGVKNVIGIEVMNEPHPGYISLPKITETFNQESNLNLGASPSALQSFASGDGNAVCVDHWIKWWPRPTKKQGTEVINEGEESVWLNDKGCIWKRAGVWETRDGKPVALIDDYFTKDPKTGVVVDFLQDFYMPFVKKFANAVRAENPDLFILFEPVCTGYCC
jgi:hypothetical protein